MAERRRHPSKPPTEPRLQNTVRLGAEGLAKVLGDLEARVLRSVWQLGRPVPARAVHDLVAEEHPVAFLTVVTVLNKLVVKGILARQKRADLLHYEARQSEAEFTALASRRLVEGILSLSSEAVTASFVDVLAKQDPEQFERLARLVRRRKRSKDGRE
ncbi:MAG: BlaI/MecI/CopY family transcriptional regulator [Gemmatimonadales bacterium]|nr:BlaI/MecI/CopY family transcriptional regulator [Gemmatimonadales bacterium]